MEKQFGWAHKLSGVEPLWTSKVGHTVLATLMESQIWHQPTGSVWGGLSKGQWPLLSPCQTLQSVSVYHWYAWNCHASTGAQREWVWVGESMCGFVPLRVSPVSSTDSIPSGFCNQKFWGLIFLAQESWAGGPGVGVGLLTPKICLPNFSPRGCGASPFLNHAPPTSLDGCGFFNSVVVRPPFNSTSDVPEWWWFYILVVILMWLCTEVSLSAQITILTRSLY